MENINEIQIKYKSLPKENRTKITNSEQAYKAFLSSWNSDTIELQEEFKIMLLNKANEVIGIHPMTKGGISSTVVDIRLLFAVTLKAAACNLILCHNHSSGNLKPSEADKRLVRKIRAGAELLDIQILDNLIISKEGYYSFMDEYLI